MTIDDEVRSMLRRKAAEIRPSGDGREAIDAKLGGESAARSVSSRRPTLGLLAAAAVAVVALVSAALAFGGDDDSTSVDTDSPAATPPPTGARLLEAVWPSAIEAEIVAGAPAGARHQYPWAAVSLYLQERLGISVSEDGFELVSGDTTNAVLRTTDGALDSEIAMQRLGSTEDPIWYVVNAKSASVSVGEIDYDGEHVQAVITPLIGGELTVEVEPADSSDPVISIPFGEVQPDDAVEIDEALPDEPGVVVRAIVRGRDDMALGEVMTPGPGAQVGPDPDGGFAPYPGASTGAPDGVWPWPDDAVEPSVLSDPVDTARAYVAARVTDVGATVASTFQPGDARSGEVVFTGDVSTTVSVRQAADGHWFVVASASDLVTTHQADEGSITVRFETAGELTHIEHISSDETEQSESYRVEGGEERSGYAYTFGRDDIVVRNSFVLDTVDGTIGLTEFALRAAPSERAPDDAIYATGGPDPIGTAQEYLRARLGFIPDDMRLNETFSGEERATVDWERGSVLLLRSAERWFVTESIGANVSFDDVTRSGGELRVAVFVGEGGTLDVLAVGENDVPCATAQATPTERGPVEVTIPIDATCELATVRALQHGAVAERPV